MNGGWTCIFEPEDHGDWYDLETAFVAMNAMLRTLGLSERFFSLNDGDQFVTVIFGNEDALRRLTQKYRLELSVEWMAPVQSGQEFEQKALKEFQSHHHGRTR